MKKALLVLIGVVLGATTCVIASNLIASNITYTPNDSTWGVNNVEAAIDSLYVSKTSNNYSADEKVVGTWIDGKPLYQKSYSVNATLVGNGGWVALGVYANDKIDQIVNSTCVGSDLNYTRAVFPLPLVIDNNYQIFVHSNIYNGTLKNVTIQYTKTTDQANN